MFRSLFGSKSKAPAVPQMDVQALQTELQSDSDLLLVDVRSPREYDHDGHVAGSRLLPLQQLPQRIDELPKDRKLAIICRSGSRSQVACEHLQRAGYTDVVNVSGGMFAWKMSGLPVK